MSVLSADNDIPTATPEESAEAATEAASQSIPTAIPTPTPGVTVVETPTPGATVVETPTPGGTVAFVGDTPPSMTPTPTPKSNKKKKKKKKKTGFDEYNAADDMPEQKKIARPLMTGWCKKKGKLAFHPRYYTLTSDGKLYSAKNDESTEQKHMLDLGEASSLNPARKTDLVIKGHNAKGRPVSITLRFNEPEERDEWVGAFITATEDIVEQNKISRKEEEMAQSCDDHNEQVLLNYYYTYKPENASREKVKRFLKLFKGNIAKLAKALGHKYGVYPDLETTNDIDYLPTPDGIFSPLSATIVSSSSESSSDSSSDSDSDSDEEAESKQDEMSELMMAVYSLLAEEPPLIYNSEAVHEGLVVRTPHLSPTPPQIEGILKKVRKERRNKDRTNKFPPTPVQQDELVRVRAHLNGHEVTEEQIVMMLWELKLTPRSVPMTAEGETLLGAGKAQTSLRRYADQYGTDAAKRLMAYDDPVEAVASRQKSRTCRREIARAFLLDTTPKEIADEYGNLPKDAKLGKAGGQVLQYYSPTGKVAAGDKAKEKSRCCDEVCRLS